MDEFLHRSSFYLLLTLPIINWPVVGHLPMESTKPLLLMNYLLVAAIMKLICEFTCGSLSEKLQNTYRVRASYLETMYLQCNTNDLLSQL